MTCPRCGDAMKQVLYSPCDKCRKELREWAAIRTSSSGSQEEATPEIPKSLPVKFRQEVQ